MAVYRRGAKGIFVVDFEYRGQRIKRSARTTNRREAERFERQLRSEVEDRAGGKMSARMTIDQAINRYLDTVIVPVSRPENVRTYVYSLGLLREFIGGETDLDAITPKLISDLRAHLVRGRKSNTVNRYLTHLRAILNQAVEWGVLRSAPRIASIPTRDERFRVLTSEEEKRLLAAAPLWLRNLLIFYLDTGARKSEALRITWADVDLTRKPRGTVRFTGTKNGESRTLPLPERCRAMLQALRAMRPAECDHVFLAPDHLRKQPAPIGDFKKAWTSLKERAGVDDLRVHDLRHTYASRLTMAKISHLTAQKLTGHKVLRMLQRYTHLNADTLDDAINTLESRP
jgi:integrase